MNGVCEVDELAKGMAKMMSTNSFNSEGDGMASLASSFCALDMGTTPKGSDDATSAPNKQVASIVASPRHKQAMDTNHEHVVLCVWFSRERRFVSTGVDRGGVYLTGERRGNMRREWTGGVGAPPPARIHRLRHRLQQRTALIELF